MSRQLNRLVATLIAVCLFVEFLSFGNEVAGADSDGIEFPAVIPLGAKGPIVFDLHATLNERLGGKTIPLPPGFKISTPIDAQPPHEIYVLIIDEDNKIRVPSDWIPQTNGKAIDPNTLSEGDTVDVDGITLPRTEAIRSVGIYGEQTYALVMLFQIKHRLKPTGTLNLIRKFP